MTTDILIVGKGAAGMATALYLAKLRPEIQIRLMDKSGGLQSATRLAQGGLAAVQLPHDSFEAHVKDTLEAGHYQNRPEAVWEVISRAPEIINDLSNWGVRWDRDESDKLHLGLEGGHSYPRIVHQADHSGKTIHEHLTFELEKHKNINPIAPGLVRDLWIKDSKCIGVIVWREDSSQEICLQARHVILATGGSGAIFPRTTNPPSATGDGLAMGIRAGVKTAGLHWIQFHPTVLLNSGDDRAFLLTEALRGAGAYVVNSSGRRFLFDSLPKGELAPRDLICSAIWNEITLNPGQMVYLDCRHFPKGKLHREFPQVSSLCSQVNLDPEKVPLPILPAAHYQCGGIIADRWGKTSLPGLFAIGEVAHTGLHGSNRLASNSLTEALVYAKNAASYLANQSLTQKQEVLAEQIKQIFSLEIPEDNSPSYPWKDLLFDHFIRKTPPGSALLRDIRLRLQILNLGVNRGIYSSKTLQERNLLQVYLELFNSMQASNHHDLHYQEN
ncbi:FAD-binding protein [Algoriphagus aestuariicola]|uniref:L-aspartate oxidase n=1 Tax=Algoriphagus aestuariicola TaxID=1852016 RepID=A0ABS3BRI6_9BACT|nr:FAD-binding protein [Algoriphagus aestuariicola]MBN7801898.1 FAD-binding protein [Algoriphagus aestuariicola]